MKKCPFCTQVLQEEAHHCHHCNSMVIDMDGNPVVTEQTDKTVLRQAEWLEKVMRILVTIFFTVQFFIDGLIILRLFFGISIIKMNSGLSISINIILLMVSVVGALLISPLIINWVKQSFERVIK